MALTDIVIRKTTCPADKKHIKKYDAHGLFVIFNRNGRKIFRYRFTLAGKEKLMTLGDYPALSLKDARKEVATYKATVLAGTDPAIERERKRNALTLPSQNYCSLRLNQWRVNGLRM